MKEEDLKKLVNYSFYDEQNQYCVVLNEQYLKKLFKADIILLNEVYKNK